jgi:hypothetical protein
MIVRGDGTRYSVRLSVPRNGGLRAWGAVSGGFERRLAAEESPAVTAPRIESETPARQGLRPGDYLDDGQRSRRGPGAHRRVAGLPEGRG